MRRELLLRHTTSQSGGHTIRMAGTHVCIGRYRLYPRSAGQGASVHSLYAAFHSSAFAAPRADRSWRASVGKWRSSAPRQHCASTSVQTRLRERRRVSPGALCSFPPAQPPPPQRTCSRTPRAPGASGATRRRKAPARCPPGTRRAAARPTPRRCAQEARRAAPAATSPPRPRRSWRAA